MNIDALLKKLDATPKTVEFDEVMQVIDDNYAYTAANFQCGDVKNEAGSNQGSCKILAFAKMHKLSEEKTPYLFGAFYRDDVLQNPGGDDHGNIRGFLQHGWSGVVFENNPLQEM